MARLHVLGSGGWIPTPHRQTNCYLLESRGSLVFFDCGTGLSRLHDPMFQILLKRHRRAVILLSHWHHDHVEGLHYLPFFLGHMEVVLAAPGKQIMRSTAENVLARFGGKPLLPVPFAEWGARFQGGFRVQEIVPGANEVLGTDVVAVVQPHMGPSVGYRVGDLAYVTDTCARDETVELARDAKLLIHDAYLDEEGARENPESAEVHGVATEAAKLAERAGVQDLLLGHLNPAYDAQRLDRMLLDSCAAFRRCLLATDMMVIDLHAASAAVEGAPDGDPPLEASSVDGADDDQESSGDGAQPEPADDPSDEPADSDVADSKTEPTEGAVTS